MTNDDIIKQKVKHFICKQLLFTSINIANSIKSDGLWIKNSDVASWLRNEFHNVNNETGDNYLTDFISVNGSRKAILYFPFFSNADDYKDRNLQAISPDEFQKMHGYSHTDKKALVDSGLMQTLQSSTATPVIMPARKITEYVHKRIRIPGAFIKAIGLKPGDLVSSKHEKIGLNLIPAGLKVHNDYRVSLPRKNVMIDGQHIGNEPIHISLKDGKIHFELTSKKN